VGQAVDVTTRYGQHRQTYSDIVKISFRPFQRDQLNSEERNLVRCLEEQGYKLRNIALTSIPYGPSEFDDVMTRDEQERWLRDLSFLDLSGERVVNDDLRRNHYRRYLQLKDKPYTTEIIQVLRAYVRAGIPAVLRSELSFWSCSCLPQDRVYVRINVNWQEVLTAGMDERGPFFSFHLAKTPVAQGLWWLRCFLNYGATYTAHQYEPGGQDQIHFQLRDSGRALRFIDDPRILEGIRLFNIRLMRKGRAVNNRSHCFHLADALLE
jgi:hypothetical protein